VSGGLSGGDREGKRPQPGPGLNCGGSNSDGFVDGSDERSTQFLSFVAWTDHDTTGPWALTGKKSPTPPT